MKDILEGNETPKPI